METKMDLSRRSFLGGALALVAATTLPLDALPASVPTIYGDGFHDDTAGLNAALSGRPFRMVDGGAYVVRRDGHIYLGEGTFKLSDTLNVTRPNTTIAGCRFDGRAIPSDRSAILFHKSANGCVLMNCYIEGAKGGFWHYADNSPKLPPGATVHSVSGGTVWLKGSGAKI